MGRWPSTPGPWIPTASTWPRLRCRCGRAGPAHHRRPGRPGDLLIGLPSPGLRSNGYSLARRVLLEVGGLPLDEVADDLLLPSVIYAPAVVDTLAEVDVRGVAHITGGGIPGNLPRALPDDVGHWLDPSTLDVPPIFGRIQELGEVSDEEMAKVFNLGIGMVLVVPPADAGRALSVLADHGHAAVEIGAITPGAGEVHLT